MPSLPLLSVSSQYVEVMRDYIHERSSLPYYYVYESPRSFLIEIDLPGLSNKDALEIELNSDQELIVSGTLSRTNHDSSGEGGEGEGEGEGGDYPVTESRFHRTFKLRNTIDHDYVTAKLADGVLSIVLRKWVGRKIEVK